MKLTKIKNKTTLKELLRDEGYDKIAIWSDGIWSDVGTNYGGEQDGNNPSVYIARSQNYDLTYREINSLVKNKEAEINRR